MLDSRALDGSCDFHVMGFQDGGAQRWALPLALGVLAVGLAILALRAIGASQAQRQRFLMASPDAIASDPALMRYAMGRGERGYSQHCANCHGADLKGDSSNG